jgi:hypothetical protein
MSSTAEAGGCHPRGYGGFYGAGFAPSYGHGFGHHSGFRGYSVGYGAPVGLYPHRGHYHVAPAPIYYGSGFRGYGHGYGGRGVSVRIGF